MTFLTIREAADLTGHSPHKIRRLIKAIADQPTHPDRAMVEPSAEDVLRLTAAGVQFTWKVSGELVRRELGDAAVVPPDQKSTAGAGESSDLFSLFQRAIEAKEKAEARLFEQLRVKDEQIASLNERLRESNVLMASLQKQLPDPAKKLTPGSGGAPVGERQKATTKPSMKSKRRSWLQSIFS
jgi:hypothetical protein